VERALRRGNLLMNERGIVITPNFRVDGETLFFHKTDIDAFSLRQYLLYWDKIDFPDNNLISIGSSPDIQFLIDAGILTRTMVRFRGSIDGASAYIYSQIEVMKVKNRDAPGQWSLAQTGSTLFIPKDISTESRTIEVELYKALPVPSEDVSLEDILIFKNRYNDELLSFRLIMDEIYQSVINSNDIPRAKNSALNRLEIAIRDLNKAANESFVSRLISSFKVQLNIPRLVTPAVAGMALGQTFGFSLAVGAAVGAVAGVVTFDLSVTRKINGIPNELQAYAYLHKIERELS